MAANTALGVRGGLIRKQRVMLSSRLPRRTLEEEAGNSGRRRKEWTMFLSAKNTAKMYHAVPFEDIWPLITSHFSQEASDDDGVVLFAIDM